MSSSRKSSPGAMVGLDIGSNLIKVVEAKRKKNQISVSSLGVAPIPEGVIENGVVVDPQGLGRAVKQLLKDSGVKTSTVVSSISGQSSIVIRVIDMPQMTPKELADQMKFEVEKQTVFSSSEVVMDYASFETGPVDPNAPPQQMKVLMAAAQQDVVNNHLEVLWAAGLKPLIIDIEPLAESRALVDASDSGLQNATVGVVNIGAEKTDFSIYEGGYLTYPSAPIPIAGINITRAIGVAMNETVENAELLKKQFAEVDMDKVGQMGGDFGMGFGFGTMDSGEESDFSSPINFIGAQDDALAPASPFIGAQPEPEQTYASPFAPPADQPINPSPFASPFDFGEPEQPAAPEAKPEEEAAAPFKETTDGPVFDLGDDMDVQPPAKPSFDLSDDLDAPGPVPQAEPAADGPFASPFASPFAEEPQGEQPQTPSEPAAFHFDLEGDAAEVPVGGAVVQDGENEPTHMSFDAPAADEPVFGSDPAAGNEQPSWGAAGEDETKKQQVFDAIAPVLFELAAELRRSIEYYRTKSQVPLEKLFITGGTAKIMNLDKFLTNELGLPVELADPFGNVPVSSNRYSEQYLKEISPLFTVSLGLAIRDML